MHNNIEIIVSTNNKNIEHVIENFNSLSPTKVLIIQQTDIKNEIDIKNENIKLLTFSETGLSKARNRGLEYSSGDIIVVADDDLKYLENFTSIIEDAFQLHPEIDIITFQITTPEGKPYKKYKDSSFLHNIFSINKVSSVEIAFRKKKIAGIISFDENFGLGSKYPLGEETIFLADAIKNGLKILYMPIPIVIHPKESSGKLYTEKKIIARGAKFKRIYGYYASIIAFLFAIKKYKEYNKQFSFIQYINLIFKGIKQIKDEYDN
jgi:glycosyltransferase involved in cell wall biosynthesis